MNTLLQAYIQERYGNEIKDLAHLEEVAIAYADYLARESFQVLNIPGGFITFKLQGDACIVNDVYTTKDARKKGVGWKLFYNILKLSKKAGKNVIIGFSEHLGRNHEDGLGFMKAAGFKKAFDTEISQVFIRGVY